MWSRFVKCRCCHQTVSRKARTCPHCGEPNPAMSHLRSALNQTPKGVASLGAGLAGIGCLLILVPALLVLMASCAAILLAAEPATKTMPAEHAYHKVVKIIDGDTVTVKIEWADFARTETVRLLGVDAPERKVPYAKESKTWMTNLLKGEEVRLEYHPGPNPTRDRYGRILAYVYRAPDDFDVNLELVRQGYAELYTSAKHRRQEDFTAAADHARTRKKGLWEKSGG